MSNCQAHILRACMVLYVLPLVKAIHRPATHHLPSFCLHLSLVTSDVSRKPRMGSAVGIILARGQTSFVAMWISGRKGGKT